MENNINILDEINKGCCMGIDALKFVIVKVNEDNFRELLENQIMEYADFSARIYELYNEYTSEEVHETTRMDVIK